jgi:hypothetical protein
MARRRERTATRPVDWRQAADPDDLREYDAFGPWVDRVRDEVQMPRLFRPWYPELRDATFLLKVPRNVDRAAARPGMDLYDAILAVHDLGVTLLKRGDRGVTRQDASWRDVVGCATYTNLLLARWTLLLADGSQIELDHNSVASQVIASVTEEVRRRIVPDTVPAVDPHLPSLTAPQDYFGSALARLTRTFPAPVAAIHLEPRNRLCRDARNRRRLSTGVMVVDTPRELVVVSRGTPTRPLFAPDYATNTLLVPYGRLTSFDVAPATGKPGSFGALVLRAGDQVVSQPCLDKPEAPAAALAARGVRRRASAEPVVAGA